MAKKSTTTKTATKKSTAKKGTAKKSSPTRRSELRKPQIEILKHLMECKGSCSRTALASVIKGSLSEHVGPIRQNSIPNKYTVGLEEQNLVKQTVDESEGVIVSLTALGKKKAKSFK